MSCCSAKAILALMSPSPVVMSAPGLTQIEIRPRTIAANAISWILWRDQKPLRSGRCA